MVDNPEPGHAELPAGLKILVADDEERLRFVLTLMLEELGAEVVAVDSCEKALELYGAPGERFDVAVLDLRMRGMGGAAACRAMLARDPDARVVLSSGLRPTDDLLAEFGGHRCAFIEKPFDIEQLAQVLGGIVSRR
ncbi:MAG: response regulator [Proteobacteria bacterium]|jgi:CheY-like chemotaxis protein|nr:response regulator [Pseudomonadota bacterium]